MTISDICDNNDGIGGDDDDDLIDFNNGHN